MSTGSIGDTKVVTAAGVDLNQAQNTVLLSYVASKPLRIQRFGVVADAATGLLAPTRLKVRVAPITTGTAADMAGAGILDPGGARARGVLVYKEPIGSSSDIEVSAGDVVQVAIEAAAGGTSTGNVWLEFVELPFAGARVPATAIRSV